MNPMSDAPRDGTRILLKYYVKHYKAWEFRTHRALGSLGARFRDGGWEQDGEKWEEMSWKPRNSMEFRHKDDLSEGVWKPWEGNPRSSSTHSVQEEDAIGWLPRPED